MKRITNSKTSMMVQGIDGDVYVSDMLMAVVNSPSKNGINILEMRNRISIIDAISKSEKPGFIDLENSEFDLTRKLFLEFGWLVSHKNLVEIADHLEEVSKQK